MKFLKSSYTGILKRTDVEVWSARKRMYLWQRKLNLVCIHTGDILSCGNWNNKRDAEKDLVSMGWECIK